MSGKNNLIPQAHVLTVAEQSAGGIASGEARRRRKQLREDLLAMLDEVVEFKTKDGQSVKATVQAGVARKLIKQAIEGNLKAIELMAKLSGEFEQKVKVEAEVSGDGIAPLTLGEIDPEALAMFILDAQKKKQK